MAQHTEQHHTARTCSVAVDDMRPVRVRRILSRSSDPRCASNVHLTRRIGMSFVHPPWPGHRLHTVIGAHGGSSTFLALTGCDLSEPLAAARCRACCTWGH